ncbi:MAG: AAA family ATPase [Lachnospiraceae bacterium]|nr:AAA family ATPase [Lachnospiraceae bacterium]
MPEKTYTNSQLYSIAADNYELLKNFCMLLTDEGYWSTAEQVLHMKAEEILDIYLESLLVCFAAYCNRLDPDEKAFIASLSATCRELIEKCRTNDELLKTAERFQKNPPIILQLLSLRDVEKNSGYASLFFDALINIMLSLAYLNGHRQTIASKYFGMYFDRISVFLANDKNKNQAVDNKYIFKKMCHDDLENAAADIRRSEGDFGKYKMIHLFYTSEQLRPVQTASVSDVYVERKGKKLNGKVLEEIPKSVFVPPEINEVHPAEKKTEKNDTDAKILETVHDARLNDLLDELNSLVGLSGVKNEIRSLINLIKVRKMREQYKLPEIEMSYHMVFTGSPGTGKTTVARIVGKIYRELGILSKGTVTETDRSGLVAGYVGQTALKVREVVEKSLGGVLFIDEAYALNSSSGNDFGQEALDTLVKLMEDHRNDLVVIVAGYTAEMQEFLKANTGLVSRFNRFIFFPDYSDDELLSIFEGMASKNGFVLDEDVRASLMGYLSNMDEKERKEFGNARGIRNLFEAMIVNQANRVVSSEVRSMEQLTRFKIEDISW